MTYASVTDYSNFNNYYYSIVYSKFRPTVFRKKVQCLNFWKRKYYTVFEINVLDNFRIKVNATDYSYDNVRVPIVKYFTGRMKIV